MSGVDIVGTLLREDAALTAIVPEARIKAGALPSGIPLPAVLLRSISTQETTFLKPGDHCRLTERVEVAVRAASYREVRQLIGLIRDACRGRTGAIAGCARVAVLPAGTGPDLRGPGETFERAQDFRVSFETPA